MLQGLRNTRQRWSNWRHARLRRRLAAAGLAERNDVQSLQAQVTNLQMQVYTLQGQVSHLLYQQQQVPPATIGVPYAHS